MLRLQTVLGVPWSHINWLNPELPLDAAEVEAGTTICTMNGPTPESYEPTQEPGKRQHRAPVVLATEWCCLPAPQAAEARRRSGHAWCVPSTQTWL